MTQLDAKCFFDYINKLNRSLLQIFLKLVIFVIHILLLHLFLFYNIGLDVLEMSYLTAFVVIIIFIILCLFFFGMNSYLMSLWEC